MGTKFKEALEKLGGKCPICGNDDHKKMVVGTKKLTRCLEQIFFFCLGCGEEISKENGKICIALISKTFKNGTEESKYMAKIEFKDLETYVIEKDPSEKEANSVLRVLTAWDIPLHGPPPPTGNE